MIDAGGRLVTPGLVDFHTHLVFGDDGSRAEEFAALSAGRSYVEIARAGGGIRATMRATRAASDAELVGAARARARRLLAWGVTTVEVKSGYGESVEEELRLLRVIRELGRAVAGEQDVVATVLPLHALPAGRDREGWVREVVEVLLPAVAREGLASSCDAFVAATAFTVGEARRVLAAARALGLAPRLHADQLSDDRPPHWPPRSGRPRPTTSSTWATRASARWPGPAWWRGCSRLPPCCSGAGPTPRVGASSTAAWRWRSPAT